MNKFDVLGWCDGLMGSEILKVSLFKLLISQSANVFTID